MKGPLSCLTQARYGIAWGVLGAALACYETALAWSQERLQFGRPIGSFQLTQAKLVDMASGLVHGHLLAHHLALLKDRGALTPVQVSLAKRDCVRTAIDTARSARTVLGATGIMADHPVMRHAQNLESVLTYEGTDEVHTLTLGRALTGLDAFA
jgi:glutaryl-CoA dehydrogenase